jgi:hypothetical protein
MGILWLLGMSARSVAAQQAAPAALSSNLARVQLVAVVPPSVTFTPRGAIREVSRTHAAAELAAPLGVRVNTAYRVVVHRVPDTCRSADGAERRVWVRLPDGAFTEVTTGPAVISRIPRAATADADELQYRVTTSSAACDTPLPVRYDIQVAPTT